MDIQTITMPKQEALEAFRAYRAAVRTRHSQEDAAIMRGYKVLAKGLSVLDLYAAIKRGGVNHLHRPRFAVMRADATRIRMTRQTNGAVSFIRAGHLQSWSRWHRVTIPAGILPPVPGGWEERAAVEADAIVPLVPPRLRPAAALSNYHVLWEAEWENIPPRDPVLLRHLAGALYAVVATWDLTPLERAVLEGRR